MTCEHKNVKTSSIMNGKESFDELFTITCANCNQVLHSSLDYDSFIKECSTNEYILIK